MPAYVLIYIAIKQFINFLDIIIMKQIFIIAFCTVFTISVASAKETKKKTVKFFIENMDCNNCIKKIERNIAFEKGVSDLKCDLPSKTAEVTYRTDKTTEEKLIKAFKKIDLKARKITSDKKQTLNKKEGINWLESR